MKQIMLSSSRAEKSLRILQMQFYHYRFIIHKCFTTMRQYFLRGRHVNSMQFTYSMIFDATELRFRFITFTCTSANILFEKRDTIIKLCVYKNFENCLNKYCAKIMNVLFTKFLLNFFFYITFATLMFLHFFIYVYLSSYIRCDVVSKW